jgi:succinate dehydrogenase (ubiquinone) cytochrome b560 subunit
MSIAHRFTGVGLSAGIYAFGIYYALAQPANMTAGLAGWIAHDCPAALVYAGKYVLAAPFLYHTLNGIRHLVIKHALILINVC